MSIYKGSEEISAKVGPIGPPGLNSSGGSDMGSIIVQVAASSWVNNGSEFVRVITPDEHRMAASAGLIAITKIFDDTFTSLAETYDSPEISTDGTITLRSSYAWQGVCIVAGGIAQSQDPVGRQMIEEETARAENAENVLQQAIDAETARATAAEAQALADAQDYTDEQIANTVAAAQTWLPSVTAFSDLPTPTDTTKTYLCRVTSENNVYQCVAGQTTWELYSENTDYVDEDELAAAVQAETARATTAEQALQTAIDNEVARATAAETQALADGKTYTDTQIAINKAPLYSATGQATDGAMTQKAVSDALDALVAGAFVPYVASVTWNGTTNSYQFTLTASTHGKGTTPLVVTKMSGNAIDCSPAIDSMGNITIYSNANLLNVIMEVR